MKSLNYTTFAWMLASGAVASGLSILLRKVINGRKKPVVECILFSPRDIHYIRTGLECMNLACPLCGFKKLCSLLRTPRFQLDVCMYVITELELTNIVVALFRRGVDVRVIADKQMNEEAHKSKIGVFMKYNVPVKYMDSKGMMHNKFVIIDKKVLLTGSCNWTQHGFMSNYENVILIRDERICQQFVQYFNDLWAEERCVGLLDSNDK